MASASDYAQNKWPTFPIHNSWGGWGNQYMYPQGVPNPRCPPVEVNKPEECVVNVKVKGNIKVTINVEAV